MPDQHMCTPERHMVREYPDGWDAVDICTGCGRRREFFLTRPPGSVPSPTLPDPLRDDLLRRAMAPTTGPTRVVHVRDPYDVYIGRANPRHRLPASPWANPFRVGHDGSREQVIEKYRQYLMTRPDLLRRLGELRGKRLGCYCAPLPCHGHILAALADGTEAHDDD